MIHRKLPFAVLAFTLAAGASRAEEAVAPAPPPVESAASQDALKDKDSPSYLTRSFDMLHGFVDYFPEFLDRTLPGLDPSGAYRIYVRPHLGDFIHRDFVRIPVGVKWKVTEGLEVSSEVEGYVTHGLKDTDEGNGFSMARIGSKYEFTAGENHNLGLSTGFNFYSPLSHPPRELTDGMRHFQPFVAFTKPISPRYGLIGFGTFGMDFLSHSNLEPNFGGNQLHTNNMGVALGVAKGWKYFYSTLTATVVTGELMSNEGRQVYDLKPEITLPIRLRSRLRANILLKITGHATSGPDGDDFGIGSSVRVDFNFRHRKTEP